MNNQKYRREFINLKEEDPGFNILNKDVMGSCKFEKIFNKVKFKIYVYNLKRNSDNEDYNVYIINSKENNNLKLGSLDIDKYGRGEFKYELNLDEADTNLLEDFNVVAVVLNKNDLRTNNFSIPLVGYMNEETVEYRRCFYSTSNTQKASVKKFQVDLEKIEHELKDKTKNEEIKTDNEDEQIEDVIQHLEQDNNECESNPPCEEQREIEDEPEDDYREVDEEELDEEEFSELDDNAAEDNVNTMDDADLDKDNNNLTESVKLENDDNVNENVFNSEELKRNLKFDINNSEQFNNILNNEEPSVKSQFNKDMYYYGYEKINTDKPIGTGPIDYREQIPKEETRKIVEEMLLTYPKLKPFEQTCWEGRWIRIEPRDIAVLPLNVWRMINNPFLVNGYYRYNHLLLGEVKNELNEDEYILGVPSQYHPKQKNVAQLHGFDEFRCCQNMKPYVGEYGYWIKRIKI